MTRKRGRPIGASRQIAEATGVNIRMVQRAIAAGRPSEPLSDEDRRLLRFIVALRNFATFCRENNPDDVAALMVTPIQADKLRLWSATVIPWLRRLDIGEPL